jgi:hypothetical protein
MLEALAWGYVGALAAPLILAAGIILAIGFIALIVIPCEVVAKSLYAIDPPIAPDQERFTPGDRLEAWLRGK